MLISFLVFYFSIISGISNGVPTDVIETTMLLNVLSASQRLGAPRTQHGWHPHVKPRIPHYRIQNFFAKSDYNAPPNIFLVVAIITIADIVVLHLRLLLPPGLLTSGVGLS